MSTYCDASSSKRIFRPTNPFQLGVRFTILRIDPENFVEMNHRLVILPLPAKKEGKIEMSAGEIRINAHCSAKILEGSFDAISSLEGNPEIQIRIGLRG